MVFERALMESPKVQHEIGTQALKAPLDPTTYVRFAPEIVARLLADARVGLAAGGSGPVAGPQVRG
jgi:hypothetical protein